MVVLGAALVAAVITLAVVRGSGDGLAGIEANAIAAIDANGGEVESQVPLGVTPSAVAAGGGFLWVASAADGTVSRIDPETGALRTFTVGGSPGNVAYGAGSLWVTNSDARELVQINPETGAVVQTVTVGNAPGAVAVGRDAVWVANAIDGTVSRFDLSEGAVTDAIAIGPSPAGIATGAGAVWVASESTGTVVRVDSVSRTIVQAINVGNGPTAVSVGGGGVWVTNNQDGTASRIDPATNSVSNVLRVGSDPSAVAAGPDAVWVASSGDGTITRIDPDSAEVGEKITIGSSPNALALADGKLWATTTTRPAGHRGGVLRIESVPSACRCVDPAFFAEAGNPTDVVVPPLVYDGLVTYRRVAGVAGGRLVPNLAARLPMPTDNGKTYSFQLRRGLRYSNGTPVRAADFRSSLERLFTISGAAGSYQGIVGAAKCSRDRAGVATSRRGSRSTRPHETITIRLTEPDPEFLYKLALPYASLVPPSTPLRAVRAIPTIGPYRVASVDPDREIRLVRNERFRVWSPEARPDGFPDEIRFHLTDDVEARVRAVEKGAADWVDLLNATLTPERQRGVLTRYADRLHSDPLPGTFWWFLNTRVRPFDDVRVRRALNYAIDRKTLVDLTGAWRARRARSFPRASPGTSPTVPTRAIRTRRGPGPPPIWRRRVLWWRPPEPRACALTFSASTLRRTSLATSPRCFASSATGARCGCSPISGSIPPT